jgi:hypothetical protein
MLRVNFYNTRYLLEVNDLIIGVWQRFISCLEWCDRSGWLLVCGPGTECFFCQFWGNTGRWGDMFSQPSLVFGSEATCCFCPEASSQQPPLASYFVQYRYISHILILPLSWPQMNRKFNFWSWFILHAKCSSLTYEFMSICVCLPVCPHFILLEFVLRAYTKVVWQI